jgi:O-antigen ligase
MLNKANEKLTAKWLYLGVPFTALVVGNKINYDPVNITKMLALSVVGFAVLAISLGGQSKVLIAQNKLLLVFASLFSLFAISAVVFSDLPAAQNIFGLFGRNTGLLTYLALVGILIGTATIRSNQYFRKMVYGLIFAGLANVVLNAFSMMGIELIAWDNIYKTLLGTFGNPNFISSFLGIFLVSSLGFLFGNGIATIYKILALPVLGFTFYQIVVTKSIQGIVVTALGTAIVGFFLVRHYLKRAWMQIVYVAGSLVAAVFAVAGALQIGPLTQYIYKTSVSLRGEYWQAGINMGLDHPFTGVGMDGYGDWYRRARDASAMILPGPNTVTNSAHNVNIDIFAYGGFPLLISYLGILAIAAIAIVKVVLRQKKYDPVFVSLAVAWICYQAQAFISINQIGLAIWGWALTGLVIAYEVATRDDVSAPISNTAASNTGRTAKSDSTESVGTWLVGAIGAAVGFGLAISPFVADSNWRSSLGSGSLPTVQAAAVKSPNDAYRIVNIAVLFEQNKFTAQAAELARQAVKYNPDYFDAWRIMANISDTTPEEKALAKQNMIRLDPRNEEWKKLP